MIDEIIEKAWVQPKYASTYAKLCNEFTKFSPLRFSFIPADEREKLQKEKDKKGNNMFKFLLIEKVQHTFDRKSETQ